MFFWTIELLSSLKQKNGEPIYHVVVKLRQNPSLQEGDELWVNCDFNNKQYHLKTKVVGKEKIAYFPDKTLVDYGEEFVKNGLLIERTVIEAEDREAILEISEFLQPSFERAIRG